MFRRVASGRGSRWASGAKNLVEIHPRSQSQAGCPNGMGLGAGHKTLSGGEYSSGTIGVYMMRKRVGSGLNMSDCKR